MAEGTDRLTAGRTARPLWRVPMAGCTAALIAGILLSRYVDIPAGLWLVLGAGAACAAMAICWRRGLQTAAMAAALVACFAAGGLRMHVAWWSAPRESILRAVGPSPQLATVRGVVATVPAGAGSGAPGGAYDPGPSLSFLLEADHLVGGHGPVAAAGLVNVTVAEPWVLLRPGDRVELLGTIGRFRHASNPGEYDAASRVREGGVAAWCAVPAAEGVKVVSAIAERPIWERALWAARSRFREQFR